VVLCFFGGFCRLRGDGFPGGFVVVSGGYVAYIFETLMLRNPFSVDVVVLVLRDFLMFTESLQRHQQKSTGYKSIPQTH
jgi:hypothetical protein